jgi:biotin carboxyl carrier protein
VAVVTDFVAAWIALVLFALALALYLRLGTPPRRAPVRVRAPVVGRWRAVNTPADRVPSHGAHAYGQTYAVDLASERSRTDSGTDWWPLARRPEEFAAFGEEVRAPADGTVVRTHETERDHWSRTTWPAYGLMLVEGCLREITGPSRVLGNHVVLDLGGGVWATLAHLRHGSVTVEPGDRVAEGDVIARVGNSGNSSEPHIHFQLMDHRNVLFADGVPFEFEYRRDGETVVGVPRSDERFLVER